MQNIIVPIDFSVKSINALTIAQQIAKKTHGTIHLVHVVEPVLKNYSMLAEVSDDLFDERLLKELIVGIDKQLSVLKKSRSSSQYEISCWVKVGDPFIVINEIVKNLNAELVVIGAKGITDAEEFFLGSLTDKVIRSVDCPVITVKEVLDGGEFRNLVYATDMEKDQKPLINLLMRLQDLFGAKLHIVNINTRKNFRNDVDTKADLQQLADEYRLTNYTLNVFSHEDQEHGIVYFADQLGADLIAMGINEKSRFRRLIDGGALALEVSDHTYRPVLTYRTS